jgi:hypothetical protein
MDGGAKIYVNNSNQRGNQEKSDLLFAYGLWSAMIKKRRGSSGQWDFIQLFAGRCGNMIYFT